MNSHLANDDTRDAEVANCSLCGAQFEREQARYMPFCGHRCQSIDLGKWLDEQYGMPYEGSQSPDDIRMDDEPVESIESN